MYVYFYIILRTSDVTTTYQLKYYTVNVMTLVHQYFSSFFLNLELVNKTTKCLKGLYIKSNYK